MKGTTSLPRIDMGGVRAYPPRRSGFTRTFWDGLSDGCWQTTCCNACGKATFPPKPVCPHCWSSDVDWKALGQRGTLYSWTRVHAAPAVFAAEAPYAVGIVDLDDHIRLACRLLEVEGRTLQVGMPVEMVWLAYQDGPLFAARPRG